MGGTIADAFLFSGVELQVAQVGWRVGRCGMFRGSTLVDMKLTVSFVTVLS